MPIRVVWCAIAFALALLAMPRSARAWGPPASKPVTDSCLAAYDAEQTDREKGKLRSAKQNAIACARDTCPKAIAADCTKWLGQLEAALPSVVLSATGPDGADLVDVRVSFNAEILTEQLSTRAVPIDPGSYKVRFESKTLGVQETTVVIREGEQNKGVSVAFKAAEPTSKPAVIKTERPVPIAAWVLGALGIAAAGVGTGFEISGLVRKSELDAQRCPCDPAEVDAMTRSFIAGDILTIVGGASFTAGLIVLLTRPEVPQRTASISVYPLERGCFGAASFRF